MHTYILNITMLPSLTKASYVMTCYWKIFLDIKPKLLYEKVFFFFYHKQYIVFFSVASYALKLKLLCNIWNILHTYYCLELLNAYMYNIASTAVTAP